MFPQRNSAVYLGRKLCVRSVCVPKSRSTDTFLNMSKHISAKVFVFYESFPIPRVWTSFFLLKCLLVICIKHPCQLQTWRAGSIWRNNHSLLPIHNLTDPLMEIWALFALLCLESILRCAEKALAHFDPDSLTPGFFFLVFFVFFFFWDIRVVGQWGRKITEGVYNEVYLKTYNSSSLDCFAVIPVPLE